MSLDRHLVTSIQYTLGDATQPVERPAIIAHVCNDVGAWGQGFVLALSRRWPFLAASYRAWLTKTYPGALGTVQCIEVAPSLWVANLIAQHGIRASVASEPPIRYEALAQCLHQLQLLATPPHASVHLPRIGCGLAGGTWDRVEPLIVDALCAHGIAVTVYDLPSARSTPRRARTR